ncbi:MAG: phage tail protein [bacterium]
MARNYPPVGFHFKVVFSGIGDNDIDSRFQSVSGLSMEMETETVTEGGENRYQHVLPLRLQSPTLVLKRGLVKDSKLLTQWCNDAFLSLNIKPVDMTVSLLNEEHEPLMTWNIKHAWPRKWSHSDLDAEQNALAIETFELQYQFFTLQ